MRLSRPRTSAAPATERSFFSLAWPSLVENILLTLMGVISMMMVGRLGPSALAGIGAANNVMSLLIVIFAGLAVGATALVARRIGQGDRLGARSALNQSMGVGLVLGIIVGAIGVVTAYPILQLMGAEPEVARDGALFLVGVMASNPFLVVQLIGNGSLRGAGDTRTPMMITAISNVVNVIVAYPLIFGVAGLPALGIVGAAWGVIAARAVACVLVVRALRGWQSASETGGLWRQITGWRPDSAVLRQLWNIGGPAAAESGSVQLGFMFFSLIVISMGTEAFAAQQIVFSIANLSMMPGFAFSVAATTLVGQALGAGKPEHAESSTWRATLSAAIWMTVMGVVFIALPRQLIGLYTGDLTVIALGVAGLQIIGYGQAFQGIAFVLAGALRGAGDTRTTLIVGTISMWLIRLPVAYGFGVVAKLGVTGIWIAWFADWALRSGVYAWIFKRGDWKTLRI